MAVFRVRQSGRRVFAVDAYEFPGVVRQRFALQHEALSGDAVRSVEAAARQWFRLAAALGRSTLPAAAGDGPAAMRDTFRFAQGDEPRVAGLLPALFRVDREVGGKAITGRRWDVNRGGTGSDGFSGDNYGGGCGSGN